jgi:hypothetical protein
MVQLNRLPEGQQKSHAGYIGNSATFAAVWKAFRLAEGVPDEDKEKEIPDRTKCSDSIHINDAFGVVAAEYGAGSGAAAHLRHQPSHHAKCPLFAFWFHERQRGEWS